MVLVWFPGDFLPPKVQLLTVEAFETAVFLSSVSQPLALQSACWLNLPGCLSTAQASWALSQWCWSFSLCWWFWTGKSNWRVICLSLYTTAASWVWKTTKSKHFFWSVSAKYWLFQWQELKEKGKGELEGEFASVGEIQMGHNLIVVVNMYIVTECCQAAGLQPRLTHKQSLG